MSADRRSAGLERLLQALRAEADAGDTSPRAAARRMDELRQGREPFHGEQVGALLLLQGGACAACGIAPDLHRRLLLDHDHDTGLTRGLLCSSCNARAGGVYLEAAILRYLEDPPAAGFGWFYMNTLGHRALPAGDVDLEAERRAARSLQFPYRSRRNAAEKG